MTNNQRSISARRCGNKISPFVLDDGTVSKCALCNPNPQHRASIYSSYLMIRWDYTFQLDPERQTLVSPVCGVTRMGPCLASREQSCTTSAGVPPACHVSGVISHVSRARKTCTRVSPRVTKFRQFGPRGLQQSSAFWRQLGRRGGQRYCPQLHKYKSYSDIFLFCL